jgi:lysosomal-associated membrane protein 1/2
MLFETPLKMSYHCNKERSVNLTSDFDNLNSTVTMSHFNLEAFRTKIDDKLSTAKDCEGVDTPDIVPIAGRNLKKCYFFHDVL